GARASGGDEQEDDEPLHDYLNAVTSTPPPLGTRRGRPEVPEPRSWIVTARPDASPTALPNTTSLAQCWLAATREAAVYPAAANAAMLPFQPKCSCSTIAVANEVDA